MNVAIKIGDAYVANDLVDPPQVLIFQLIPKSEPEKFSNEKQEYCLSLSQVKGSPYLGYDSENKKLNASSTPVILSPVLIKRKKRLFEDSSIELSCKDGSLGYWFLYEGEKFNSSKNDPGKITNLKKYTPFIFLLIFFLVIFIFFRVS